MLLLNLFLHQMNRMMLFYKIIHINTYLWKNYFRYSASQLLGTRCIASHLIFRENSNLSQLFGTLHPVAFNFCRDLHLVAIIPLSQLFGTRQYGIYSTWNRWFIYFTLRKSALVQGNALTPEGVKASIELMLNNNMVYVCGAWNERVHVMIKANHARIKSPK